MCASGSLLAAATVKPGRLPPAAAARAPGPGPLRRRRRRIAARALAARWVLAAATPVTCARVLRAALSPSLLPALVVRVPAPQAAVWAPPLPRAAPLPRRTAPLLDVAPAPRVGMAMPPMPGRAPLGALRSRLAALPSMPAGRQALPHSSLLVKLPACVRRSSGPSRRVYVPHASLA